MRSTATRILIAAAIGWLAPLAVAQTVTTFGTLSNFDAINDTGHDCHGFEIELEDITPSDVVCTFGDSGDPANPYIRYGGPTIVPTPTGVIVRYASAYDPVNHVWAATTPQAVSPYPPTIGHQCWSLGDPNYPNSGCEHFGVCLTKNATRTTYRWLIEDPAHPGALTAFGSSVNIPAPVWNVIPQPPPAPNLPPPPPIVIAVIPAPPPPPVPPGGQAQWGEAIWVKIYTMQIPEPLEIEDLVPGGAGVPDPEVEPPEIEWKLLQSPPVGESAESEESENGGEIGEDVEAISRLYEFYKYTGLYDPETNEALCDNPISGDPRCGPVDPGTGVAGVGDLIGVQNAAVNLFEQSISFVKTADRQQASVGGTVNYTLTLSNTSAVGSPDMECTVTDVMLGIDKLVTIPAGTDDMTSAAYTVLESDPDPLVNSAEVTCHPVGFPDQLTASDEWSVDIVPPVESPAILCPPSVEAIAGMNFCSAVVFYDDPAVTPPGTAWSCVPPSGSAFPAGVTTVSCTATNETGSASCSFDITVHENPPDCADADACTTDLCVDGLCIHEPLTECCNTDDQCADDDVCTRDACVDHGCVHESVIGCCHMGSDCPDDDVCTLDACVNNACEHSLIKDCCYSDADCDDSDSCTLDRCDAATNRCTHSSGDQDGDGVCDPEDLCPTSDVSGTIILNGCDSGVENLMLEGGCTMADDLAKCRDHAVNGGSFARCIAHYTSAWYHEGWMSGREKGQVQACAAPFKTHLR